MQRTSSEKECDLHRRFNGEESVDKTYLWFAGVLNRADVTDVYS
jgi:hypothetical protein